MDANPSYIPLQSSSKKKKKRNSLPVIKVMTTDNEVARKQPPWRDPNTSYSDGFVGLHEEIIDFYKWVSPKPEDHQMRLNVVDRITGCIMKIWPQAKVYTFGSFRTGLYIPSSDVDLVVFGKWEVIPLRTLETEIEKNYLARDSSIKVIDTAKVPIIKYVDKSSGIHVDISFNVINGVNSVQLINIFKKQFPVLPKLLSVLKQFLHNRDLAMVFTGGLSSFCLTLMVISFLQMHVRTNAARKDANLGVLLMEFFELYGCNFNYDCLAISVRNGGSYIDKEKLQIDPNINSRWMPIDGIAIEDPFQPGRDISRGSHRISIFQQSCALALRNLSRGNGGLAKILNWS